MEKDVVFEIRGRSYPARITERRAEVVGVIRGKGGALLPGLVDALIVDLREAGFPACWEGVVADDDQIVFLPGHTTARSWVCDAFAEHVRALPFHEEWTERAKRHVRRRELAQKVGLLTDDRAWHDRRRALETDWRHQAEAEWAAWEHTWRHLGTTMPLGESWYWHEHRWRNQKARPEDLKWLQTLILGVKARIENLDIEED